MPVLNKFRRLVTPWRICVFSSMFFCRKSISCDEKMNVAGHELPTSRTISTFLPPCFWSLFHDYFLMVTLKFLANTQLDRFMMVLAFYVYFMLPFLAFLFCLLLLFVAVLVVIVFVNFYCFIQIVNWIIVVNTFMLCCAFIVCSSSLKAFHHAIF